MLADYSAVAAKKVISRYGKDGRPWIPCRGAWTASDSRTDDAPPWYGGDEISHRYRLQLRVDVHERLGLTILGLPMVPTAAHCLESNYSNDFYNPDGRVGPSGYDDAEDRSLSMRPSVDGDIWSNRTSDVQDGRECSLLDPSEG